MSETPEELQRQLAEVQDLRRKDTEAFANAINEREVRIGLAQRQLAVAERDREALRDILEEVSADGIRRMQELGEVQATRDRAVAASNADLEKRRQSEARLAFLLKHAHTIYHSPYTEGPIMVLSIEAIDQAIREEAELAASKAEGDAG
jgi:hypothetical protein